jgi:cell division protein FtsW
MSTLKQKINQLMRPVLGEHAPDKKLMIAVGILIIFGLVMLSSASAVVAYSKFGSTYFYFKHQLYGVIFGLLVFWFFSRVDYHTWRKYAFWFLIFSVVLLLLVFIPGLSANYGKARSWISIFGYSLQPSEFVKISFLLYLAAWLESRRKKLEDFSQGIGPFFAVLGVIALLMVMQPDIGTLSIIAVTSLIVYFVGGGSIKHILYMLVIGAMLLTVLAYWKPYQMDRFRCMVNPEVDASGVCYQVKQSLIAVGSGGIFGRGLGQSRQKFMYLPEVSGDSIFAIVGEEIGMVFSSLLIILYIYIFYRGYMIAKHAPDIFGRILAIGIVSWIVMQAIINIGGMIAFMPMTGVPLPFVSYGGTAILAVLIAIGILINISKQTKLRGE